MKQKYTLSIADVELHVAVEEAPETVEYIVGVIDRRMREILLKSKYCPKIQAALLCALDQCADKLKTKEELDALRDEFDALAEQLKKEEEKNKRAEGLTVALEKEKARLEIENMKLRAAIEQAQKTGSMPECDLTGTKAAEEAVSPIAEPAPTEKESGKKTQNKSRVGSMFDLLTFSDI